MPRNVMDMRTAALAGRGGGSTISAAGVVPYGNYARDVNTFAAGEAQRPYIANLPGYLSTLSKLSSNAGEAARGELGQDVINLMARQGAERGIATGSPGSPNANTAYLAALGLTSNQRQMQGQQLFSQLMQDTPVPQIFNPASLSVPEHMAALELQQAQLGAGGNYRIGGGPTVTASSGFGRAPGMTPWGSSGQSNPQYGQFGNPLAFHSAPTNDQIMAIANGDLQAAPNTTTYPTWVGKNYAWLNRSDFNPLEYDQSVMPSDEPMAPLPEFPLRSFDEFMQ